MRITLAYPWTGTDGVSHRPDSTVTVNEATGKRLVADGLARHADDKPASKPRKKPRKKTAPPATPGPPAATSEKE